VAGALAISAAVVPRALFPARPLGSAAASCVAAGPGRASTAELYFEDPVKGQVVAADSVEVVLDLEGGRIVEQTSTELTPDTGHVHLVLDGRLVSMTYGLVQVVDLRDVEPGPHTLQAEFVAADHAPFDPRVTAAVRFETEGP
jgi:hypothetical protein